MVAHLIVKALKRTTPEQRRVFAAWTMVASLVGWVATHIVFLLIDITGAFEHVLNAISWWSIVLTSWDILTTAEVEVDD